jgi:hypothetical protein
MIKKLLIIGLFMIFFLAISYGFKERIKKDRSFASTRSINPSVSVDAYIGEFMFTLFGYTSPYALVTIEGMGIYDQTYSDKTGYFEFHNRFSPQNPREACLTSQDQLGRITSPTCIPPFPTKYNVHIGPVLLPPTVSLNAQNYYQGDEVKLSGQAIPSTELTFSTFIDERRSFFSYIASLLVPSVSAYTFPQLTSKTDEKGNFSLSLPSSHPEFFRVFTQASYQNGQSPESVKLNIKIYPVWMVIIHLFMLLWSIIKSRLLEIIIIGELIAIIVFFLRRYLHPHVIAKSRALAIRELYTIVPEETALLVPEKYELMTEELTLMKV